MSDLQTDQNPPFFNEDEPKRSKGRPPRIDREKILEAARTIDPDKVTMQAVADILEVNPTALNYHVGGREGFMRLVAMDRVRHGSGGGLGASASSFCNDDARFDFKAGCACSVS